MKRVALISLLLLLSLPLAAQTGFVRAQGKHLVDAKGNKLILRGTNLGNWMVPEGYMWHFEDGPQSPREIEGFVTQMIGPQQAKAFWKQWRENYITQHDIEFMKRIGFNAIRVPIHYKFFTTDNAEGFALLDRVVDWSSKASIYVIIDMHAAPGGQTGTNIDDSGNYPWLFEDAEAQQQTIDIWTRIAKHYRTNKTVIGYDLLNEPIPPFPNLAKYNDKVEPLMRRITEAVRKLDPNHVMIITGSNWDSNFKVLGPPFDKNAMYTFHKYWTEPTQKVIQDYIDYGSKYNVPLLMGESGENKDEWIAKFTEVLEKNEINWTYWPYKKMDARTSICSFPRPLHWEAVTKFAQLPQRTGNAEKLIAARPSLEDSRAAFNDLLQKIQFKNCNPNPGYIKALGMKAPEAN
jgi:endoglucanase